MCGHVDIQWRVSRGVLPGVNALLADVTDTSEPASSAGDPVAATREIAERARRDVQRTQERLRSAQAIQRFCEALTSELMAGNHSEALRLLRAGKKPLALLRERSPDAAAAVEAIGRQLTALVQEAFGALPRSFPAAIQEAGLKLDPSSRHPRYTLCEGFLTVEFDKHRFETRVQPRDGRRTTLGTDLPVIMRHLRAEVERLFGRESDVEAVLTAIEESYAAAITAAKRHPGEAIPLKELVAELAKDRSFRSDEFNVDLSRLVRSELDGRSRIHLDHSRDSRNGILLWQLDQRGYYGYIRVGGSTSQR